MYKICFKRHLGENLPKYLQRRQRASHLGYLSDLLRDVLGSVLHLAGCDDFNLGGGGGSHAVGAERERDLRDAANGSESHQVGVGGGVWSAGPQICGGNIRSHFN